MKKYIFLIFGLIVLDALTKYFSKIYFIQETVIINNFISFFYVKNSGIAFSIPLTGNLLKFITVILIFGIFWYYWKEEKQKKSHILNISYSLIGAGAIGNAWERLYLGYVTDFISLEYFAVFNLADSYITLGAIGILYYYFKTSS